MNFDIFIKEFLEWYQKDEHSKNEDYYKDIINLPYLSQLSDNELISFFTKFGKEGGMIQSGGQRTASLFIDSITQIITEFKNRILEPFYENFEVEKWLDWAENVKYFGSGLSTIYLNRVDKEKFTVINKKSIEAYELLGYKLETKDLKSKYFSLNIIQQNLINKYPVIKNFYVADSISQFLIGENVGLKFYKELQCEKIVVKYINIYKNNTNINESYKWETVKYFQENWSGEIVDIKGFTNELLKLQTNLLHKFMVGTLKVFVDTYPNEFKNLLLYIYDEKLPIDERLGHFNKTCEFILKQIALINPKIKIRPDESVFAFFLTCRYPDTYYFYRSNYYEDYSKYIKSEIKGKNEKYFHYLELMEDFNQNFVKSNLEIQELTNQYLEKHNLELCQSLNILTQNVIYVGLSQNKEITEEPNDSNEDLFENDEAEIEIQTHETKYWIFQGNPAIYKIKEALKENALKTWAVNAHKNEIKIGDKIILWVTGEKSGCYALCSVLSDVIQIENDINEEKYYIDKSKNELQPRVEISIDFNFSENPVSKYELKQYNEFNNFIGGNQGTNFKATKDQYDKIKYLYFLRESNLEESVFNKYLKIINRKKQVIFQGAPGTGKSYLADIFAKYLIDNPNTQLEVIQFHSSYSYEDFIQGYRPTENGSFTLKNGVFLKFCEEAEKEPDKAFVILIDEINRGNLSKIFGELLYVLEYREKKIKLTYSPSTHFSIPNNIFIHGTMNTADRSLAMVDYALRRRFSFITLRTDYEIITKILEKKKCKLDINILVKNIENLNKQIVDNLSLGKGFEIGHSYFIKDENLDIYKLRSIWDYDICPLLEEYFIEDTSEIENLNNILFNNLS